MNNQNLPDNPDVVVQKANKTGLFTNYIYKAIPLAFDESMSYYETLCGLLNYLQNTIIPTVNNNADAVSELQNLYIELKDYVDNYFTNLDVQQEINNKLDAMVSDGTLTTLIANYVNPYIDEQNNRITSIENQLVSVASGSPAGVYATVSALTTADPNHNKIYVVTEDGKWYYYDTTETSWVAGGTYQATETITDKTLSIENDPADAYYTGIVKNHEEYVFDKVLTTNNILLDRTNTGHFITLGGAINEDETQDIYYYNVADLRNQKIKIITSTTKDTKYAFYRGSTQSASTLIERSTSAKGLLATVPNNASWLLVVATSTEEQPTVNYYTNNYMDNETDKTLSIENDPADAYYTGIVKNNDEKTREILFTSNDVELEQTLENHMITLGGNISESTGVNVYYYRVASLQNKLIQVITSSIKEVKYAFYRGNTQQPSTMIEKYQKADGQIVIVPSNANYLVVCKTSTESGPTVTSYVEKNPIENIKVDFLANNNLFNCHQGMTSGSVHANTLQAYYNAFKHGYSAIECDIRMTSDEVLVINHDATVTDTSSDTYTISQITYDELMALNLGYTIPTLKEVLNLIYLCGFNNSVLEIKPDSARVSELVSQLVYDMQMEDKVIFNIGGSNTRLQALYIENYRKVNFLTRYIDNATALTYQSYLDHGDVYFSIYDSEYGNLITSEEYTNLCNLGFKFYVVCTTLNEVYNAMSYAKHIQLNDSIKNITNLSNIIENYINN